MTLVGTVCCRTGRPSDFQPCIDAAEAGECDHSLALLLSMAGDTYERRDAGLSTTTLIGCARKHVLKGLHDYHESPDDYYARFRGKVFHAGTQLPEGAFPHIVQEVRIQKAHRGLMLTGQPDYVNHRTGEVVDNKSTSRVPREPYAHQAAQLNVYAWLLDGGRPTRGGPMVTLQVKKLTINYMDMRHEQRVPVRLWGKDELRDHLDAYVAPHLEHARTGILPPKVSEDGSHWECKFCPVRAHCYAGGKCGA